jgi:hypothetical protein
MATYTFVKTVLDTGPIWDDINNYVLIIPMPDSIENEILSYHGQNIYNPNKVTFTFSSALSGADQTTLNDYMASLNQISSDAAKQTLANLYTTASFQVITGLGAKMLEDGKSDAQVNSWFSQSETIINALSTGFLSVGLDRLISNTTVLTLIITGTWTSGEVTELRQLLQKLLGKTVT